MACLNTGGVWMKMDADAHHHDHESRGRQQHVNPRALEHGTYQHRDQREHEAYGGEQIHALPTTRHAGDERVDVILVIDRGGVADAGHLRSGSALPFRLQNSSPVAGMRRVSSPLASATSSPSTLSSSPTSAMTLRMIWPVRSW